MHLAVERNVLDDLAAVGLEGGSEIVDLHAAECCHKPVCNEGRDAAKDKIIAALTAPSADNVVAFFELGQETGDLVGVVLQVSIHCQNEVTLRMVEAGGKGRGLSEVAAQFDDQHAAVHSSDLFEETIGPVT